MGQNLLTWLQGEAQPLVAVALIIGAVIFIFKKETAKLVGFFILAAIVAVVVWNPMGILDVLRGITGNVVGVSFKLASVAVFDVPLHATLPMVA